jgi:16S rRNA (guanine966-N2)-methyltransferase
MRVIGGSMGGQIFSSPNGRSTHPMSEKMRGAIFNILGDIKGLSLLDAFAGSGAISFEAISRGASMVIAIDSDRSAFSNLLENVAKLGLDKAIIKIINVNCLVWSKDHQDIKFDIVVADPPYKSETPKLAGIYKLSTNILSGGILVVSLPPSEPSPSQEILHSLGLSELVTKNYGDAMLVFYRKLA